MLSIISTHTGAELAYGAYIVGSFALTHQSYLAFRRRRSSHGVVFNSITGKPEALVAVALRDLHGSIVRSTVTDRKGKYRLVAPKGDYVVEVRKFGYTFPSSAIRNKSHPDFQNLLTASRIFISDHGAIVKNIPIDPASAKRRGLHFPRLVLPKRLQFLIIAISPFVTFVGAYWLNSLLAWVLFTVYIGALLNRFLHFKPAHPPFGTIRDAENDLPLEGVAVRVLDKKYNKVLETQITSPKGRYAFVVNRGSFRILMKKDGYKGVILNFNGILKDGHLLAKDVKMKRAEQKEEEPAQEAAPAAPAAPLKMGDL